VLNAADDVDASHPTFVGTTIVKLPGVPRACSSGPLCSHGTATASIVAGAGVARCPGGYACQSDDVQPDFKGGAHGIGTLLSDGIVGEWTPSAGYDVDAWALGLDQSGDLGPLGGAHHAAQVASLSYDTGTRAGPGASGEDYVDRLVSVFGELWVIGAGNNGPAPGSNDCGIYDGLCIGATSGLALDPTDDQVTPYSGRGPLPDGRKKPDLVAVGDTTAARYNWLSGGAGLWWPVSGTSFSTPQVSAAAAVLVGAGIADPLLIRALLIDSARQGRSTPGAAMGTQTGWQPDWGWGELDMNAAYAERTHLQEGDVSPSQPRFFAARTQGAGDRATLTWNRRVDGAFTGGAQPFDGAAHDLTDLNLVEHERAGCAVRASSLSPVDSVEQTRSPDAADVVYAVRADSPVDGRAGEPFALVSTRQTQALTTPVPQLSAELSPALVRGGDTATLSVTVVNPSGDLDGQQLSVVPHLPAGLELVAGEPTQTDASFATHSTRTLRWTVRAAGDGARTIAVDARVDVCGEHASSTGAASLVADSAGPVVQLRAPSGTTAPGRVDLSWSAADGAGVAHYDVESSTDGAPFARWLTGTGATSAAADAAAGHSYRWRVRAADGLGNIGDYVTSAELTVPAPGVGSPPRNAPVAPGAPRRRSARLRISRVRFVSRGTAIIVRGTARRGITSRVTVRVTLRRHGRSVTVSRATRVRAGRWAARITLARADRSSRSATVSVRYAGDAATAPAGARTRVRR